METPPPTYDEALVISQSTNTPLPLYIALPSGAAAATNGNSEGEGEKLYFLTFQHFYSQVAMLRTNCTLIGSSERAPFTFVTPFGKMFYHISYFRPNDVYGQKDLDNTHRGGERQRTRKCMNGKCSKFVFRANLEQFTWKSHAGRRETNSILTYYIFNRRSVRM